MMRGVVRRLTRKSGLAPGTLVHTGPPRPEPARISVLSFDAARVEERAEVDLEACRAVRAAPGLTWINVDGVHDVKLVEELGEMFGLHPLLLEDIVSTTQRPKIEDFGEYLYIVLRMLFYPDGGEALDNEQISIVLGPDFVLTFQERPGDVFDAVRQRVRENRGRVRKSGADYLAYALMDVVIDNYFGVLERLGDQVEELEADLMEDPGPGTLQRIQQLKRSTIAVRRAVWPLREVIHTVLRGDLKHFRKPTMVFLRDAYDHTVRAVDMTDTVREMLASMLDIYLSQVSNRMNEVMKMLTLIATVFIPLTFIAGVYGMNFRYMPELEWRYGYLAIWAVMVVVAVALFVYFKRRHWL